MEIRLVNKLVQERGIPAARAYSDFGLKQTTAVNNETSAWLKRQAFNAPSPAYSSVEIEGSSDEHDEGRPTEDRVKWELGFEDQLPKSLNRGWVSSGLSDGLLHIKRAQAAIEFNSVPRIFSTANYIQIAVANGEQSWVKKGEFPKNVHHGYFIGGDGHQITTKDGIQSVQGPIYTDIRRDAQEGFRTAKEWAKFRTMAVFSSEYIMQQLKEMWKQVGRNYDNQQIARAWSERTTPLMLSLLPDTILEDGPASLKPFYEPGVLEGALTLELCKGKFPQLGQRGIDRPIRAVKGKPTQITSNNGKTYDATFGFQIGLYCDSDLQKDEKVKGLIEKILSKHFTTTLSSPDAIDITLHIPDADKVRTAILAGETNTPIHQQIADLVLAMESVDGLYRSWREQQMPLLNNGFKAMVEAGKQTHFETLERRLDRLPLLEKQ